MGTGNRTLGCAAMVLIVTGCLWGRPTSAGPGKQDEQTLTAGRAVLRAAGVHGGLVVHLGCGDGRLTAALHAGDSYLVHGLDGDGDNIREARRYIASLGLYGPVSVAQHGGRRLPYADNLVNLVVVTGEQWRWAGDELARILAPNGVAMIRGASVAAVASLAAAPCDLDGWTKLVKPWPEGIDQWTHFLHGPDNHAVAEDSVVGPPRHFQWIAEPRFSRSHDHLANVSAVVTAGGRLFAIVDMGSMAFVAASPRWRVVARDAFSGVLLWQREIPNWEYHLRDFRSGPADLARRLVAVGDRVYVTLGYDEPVSCLDAATGRTIRTYTGTDGTQEIVHWDEKLFLVTGQRQSSWPAEEAKRIVSQTGYRPPFERYTPPVVNKRVLAVDAASGETLWGIAGPEARDVMPCTLAVDAGRVYFQNAEAVVCADAATGQVKWKFPRPVQRRRLAWSTPTLVVYDGVVYSADRKAVETSGELFWIPSGGYHEYIRGDVGGELVALDAETGRRLWSCPAYEGFNAPVDIFITGGLLWTGRFAWGQDPGITEGRDPKTGEVVFRRPPDQQVIGRIGHARCHRFRATCKYLLLGRRGVEFVDIETGEMIANRFVRGNCQYGFLPANGLIYIPPHACACSVTDLLKWGFLALAPEGTHEGELLPSGDDALERGPAGQGTEGGERRAEGKGGGGEWAARQPAKDSQLSALDPRLPTVGPQRSTDWPTYRHDASRSGSTATDVPPRLRPAWSTSVGGKLTSPVSAAGVVLVADKDAHRIHALDAASGRQRWTYAAGGRIDSPPTVDRGRVLFGSADGWVYCLSLDDGRLVWRFRAAPRQRLIVVNEQLESAWPVSGSVLVLDEAAYFVAGRSSYLDGGMFFYKLDVANGRVLKSVKLEVEKEKRDRGGLSGGYLPDVLSAMGESVFLRSARFDRDLVPQPDKVPHLWSSVGFLDDTWWHRTYWQFGTSMASGWGGWPRAGRQVPSGRLLVTDGQRIFGYGRNQYDIPGAHVGVDAEGVWGPIAKGLGRWTYYRLFGKTVDAAPSRSGRRKGRQQPETQDPNGWSRTVPVLARAMVLAGDTLFVAGPEDPLGRIARRPEEVDHLAAALESTRGGRLLALSTDDGQTLADCPLPSPPVFDGMAAAAGRLFLATKRGEIVCLAAAQ
ncbi:MAG TPA: methyltransferase domain-containing protein [Planctomycetes bacterium]|nr:methyltransferase domain-containing protein [Planctomycetota bacterium]